MSGKLRSRLVKLERSVPQPAGWPTIVCVDGAGLVLEDGSTLTAPWVGRPIADLLAARDLQREHPIVQVIHDSGE